MRGLNRLYWIKKDIAEIEEELKRLSVIKASATSSLPKGNMPSSPVENFVLRIEKLQEKLSKKYDEYISEKEKIEEWIEGIADVEVRVIARMRYVACMKWEDIGDALDMDRTTPKKKIDRYLERENGYE